MLSVAAILSMSGVRAVGDWVFVLTSPATAQWLQVSLLPNPHACVRVRESVILDLPLHAIPSLSYTFC